MSGPDQALPEGKRLGMKVMFILFFVPFIVGFSLPGVEQGTIKQSTKVRPASLSVIVTVVWSFHSLDSSAVSSLISSGLTNKTIGNGVWRRSSSRATTLL